MGPKRNIYTKLAIVFVMLTICVCPGLGMAAASMSGNFNNLVPFLFLTAIGFGISILFTILGNIQDRKEGKIHVNEFDPSDPFGKTKGVLSVGFFLFITAVGFITVMIPWERHMQFLGFLIGAMGAIATVVQIIRNIRSENRYRR